MVDDYTTHLSQSQELPVAFIAIPQGTEAAAFLLTFRILCLDVLLARSAVTSFHKAASSAIPDGSLFSSHPHTPPNFRPLLYGPALYGQYVHGCQTDQDLYGTRRSVFSRCAGASTTTSQSTSALRRSAYYTDTIMFQTWCTQKVRSPTEADG